MYRDIYIRLLARNLAYKEIKRTTAQIEQMGKTAKLLSIGTKAIVAAGAISAMTSFARSMKSFIAESARVEDVERAFHSMSSSVKVDANSLLSTLRELSHGAVADVDLMLAANKALMSGNKELIEAMPRILNIARAVSMSTGQDISKVYDDITRGILKASPRIIDNAEIYINVTKTIEDYAKSIGKSSDEIDDTTKRHLILQGVLEQGEAYIDRMGLSMETNSEKVKSMTVAWQELKRAIGDALVEAGAADAIARAADIINPNTRVPSRKKLIDTYGDQIESLVAEISRYDMDAAVAIINRARKIVYTSVNGNDALKDLESLTLEANSIVEKFKRTPVANWGDSLSRLNVDLGLVDRKLTAVQQKSEINLIVHKTGFEDAKRALDSLLSSAADIMSNQELRTIGGLMSGQLGKIAQSPISTVEKSWEYSRLLSSLSKLISLRRKAEKPITIEVYGADDAKQKLDSLLVSMVDLFSNSELLAMRGLMVQEIDDIISEYDDPLERMFAVERILDNFDKAVSSVRSFFDESDRAARESASNLESYYSSASSRIESVLKSGLTVTQSDMWATEIGTYADKPLESARRLADIVNRGTQSPWVAMFNIPEDVLRRGEAAVKLWAANLQRDVESLARPDLIDWGAFVESYKKSLSDEAMRKQTVDIAMQKLKEAGLLTGNEAIDKYRAAQMLGVATPEMQVEAYSNGLTSALDKKDPAKMLLESLQSGVDRDSKKYQDIGATIGEQVAKEFGDAFIDNVDIADQLIEKIVPMVLERINVGEVALP